MYNYKYRKFVDGTVESRFYSHVVYTGEKKIENRREYEENPFDGELVEVVYDFEELAKREEHSKQVSRNRTIQNVYSYARANVWEHFLTLTFSPDKVNRFDYAECARKLSDWLKNIHRVYPEMRHLFVPEHHKDGAFHFHGLVSGIWDIMQETDLTTKGGQKIYNVGKYRLGFTTATECGNLEACSKYITKYITKDLCELTKGKRRYWVSKNCDKPEEMTMILDREDRAVLQEELLKDALKVKTVETKMGLESRCVTYFENPSFSLHETEEE